MHWRFTVPLLATLIAGCCAIWGALALWFQARGGQALKTLSVRGLQAGRDIALIGFDDLTICRFTQPALSTIQFAPSEIAPLAFRALLDEIEGVKDKTAYEYKTKFVLRESTCAPKP